MLEELIILFHSCCILHRIYFCIISSILLFILISLLLSLQNYLLFLLVFHQFFCICNPLSLIGICLLYQLLFCIFINIHED